VGEYITSWLASREWRSARTQQDYQDIRDRYILPALGRIRLAELRPAHIRELYSELRERGIRRRREYTHAVLRAALRQAEADGALPGRNPIAAVKAPTSRSLGEADKGEGGQRFLNHEELGAFLSAAESSPQGVMFIFALGTGVRPGELRALRWSDLSDNYNRVNVERSVEETKDGPRIKSGGKTKGSRRSISLPAELAVLLHAHRARQAAARLTAADWQDIDLLFPDARGELLSESSFGRAFKSVLRSAGLPLALTPYVTRHTHATHLLADGQDILAVSQRLGHANVTMTLSRYHHVIPSMEQKVVDAAQRLFFSGRHTA
jgi:integrase